MNLIRVDINDTDNGFRLSDALDLYLKLKGIDKDKTFIRTANRNTEYVIQVLGNKSVTAYSSSEAAQFRDWLINKGMGKSTVKRVLSSIRSIINLIIKEHGLEGNNGFLWYIYSRWINRNNSETHTSGSNQRYLENLHDYG